MRGFGPKIVIPTDRWERRKRLVIAIRRNEISFSYAKTSEINILNAAIIDEHFLGSRTIFQLRLENGDLIEAEIFTKDIPMNLSREITLSFKIADVMSFEYPEDLDYELALE